MWRKIGLMALIGVCAMSLAQCAGKKSAAAAPAADTSSVRSIAQGTLRGLRTANGAQAWLSIPFAAAPMGDLRFRAPRPAASWRGTFDATTPPPRCAQLTNRLDEGRGVKAGLVVGSEDCLKLSIFAPAFGPDQVPTGDKRLPVMVWIHGGANVWGAAADYDGSILAARHNVIVVTVSYRLAGLGWFAHDAIRASAQTELDRSANFATLDLVASLQWVRDNIGAFGGNDQRVTIFGESAGGHNVASLLVAPQAKGLFQGAIIQSGLATSEPLAEAEGVEGKAINSARVIVAKLGLGGDLDIARKLRNLDLKTFLTAYQGERPGFVELPRVIADDIVIPKQGLLAALASRETQNVVPLITGTNHDEMKLFQSLDPRFIKKSFGLFPVARNPNFYDLHASYQTRIWRAIAVDHIIEARAQAGISDNYAYRFDWDEAGKIGSADLSQLLGACHAMEIPFVFGKWSFFGSADNAIFNAANEAERVALSNAMQDYWVAFARTGNPGTGGVDDQGKARQPIWSDFDRDAPTQIGLVFDSQKGGGIRANSQREHVSDILAQLRTDPGLREGNQTCLVAGSLQATYPLLSAEIAPLLHELCVPKSTHAQVAQNP